MQYELNRYVTDSNTFIRTAMGDIFLYI